MPYLTAQLDAADASMPFRVGGLVHGISGLTLEAAELPLPIGSLCRISSFGDRKTLAEVIGFRQDHTLLMPLSPIAGVARGAASAMISVMNFFWPDSLSSQERVCKRPST